MQMFIDPAELAPQGALYVDEALGSIRSRAGAYLDAGAPVHFRGPAGAGKTTLALQVAADLGRPVVLITGDAWLTTKDLLGQEAGTRTRRVEDRFIHNVQKSESETTAVWEDRALTVAFEEGATLVYDEFTRSPPQTNNPLLSALEEGILVFATRGGGRRYVRAHPQFRAIFTSNPEDYAGVQAPQDALVDRMITFDLTWHAEETEVGVVAARSGLSADAARPIVRLVRALRERTTTGQPPSMRSAILIARIAAAEGVPAAVDDDRFVQLCFDVLESRAPRSADLAERQAYFDHLYAVIRLACPRAGETPALLEAA